MATLMAFSLFHVIYLWCVAFVCLFYEHQKQTGVVVLNTPEFCYF